MQYQSSSREEGGGSPVGRGGIDDSILDRLAIHYVLISVTLAFEKVHFVAEKLPRAVLKTLLT